MGLRVKTVSRCVTAMSDEAITDFLQAEVDKIEAAGGEIIGITDHRVSEVFYWTFCYTVTRMELHS